MDALTLSLIFLLAVAAWIVIAQHVEQRPDTVAEIMARSAVAFENVQAEIGYALYPAIADLQAVVLLLLDAVEDGDT